MSHLGLTSLPWSFTRFRMYARAVAQEQYAGLLGLDRLPRWAKATNWLIATALATVLTIPIYLWVPMMLSSKIGVLLVVWILAAPSCLAAVWLRLTGLRWRHALAVFPMAVLFSAPTALILAGLIASSFIS